VDALGLVANTRFRLELDIRAELDASRCRFARDAVTQNTAATESACECVLPPRARLQRIPFTAAVLGRLERDVETQLDNARPVCRGASAPTCPLHIAVGTKRAA
jgi:hypothetical protein